MSKVTYVPIKKTYAPPEARFFIEDIIRVCKKHGFSLSFEGSSFSGEFIVTSYSESAMEVLRDASLHIVEEVNDG